MTDGDPEGNIEYANEVFTEKALREQDGKEVPVTLYPGGPVIGIATMKYDDEEKVLRADFNITDQDVREWFEGHPPMIFRPKES